MFIYLLIYFLFIYLFVFVYLLIYLFIYYYLFIVIYFHVLLFYLTCLVFICICTCLAMLISFHVCLNCRGRVVTKVARTCNPTPLLYQRGTFKGLFRPPLEPKIERFFFHQFHLIGLLEE